MTVKELIEVLERHYSPDAEVQIQGEEGDWSTRLLLYSRGLHDEVVRMEPR